jgi:opacity protein-like surface antigen
VTKSKLWVSLAAGAVLALALGSAALATDLTDTNDDQDPGAPAHATRPTLPDKASSVAKAVLAALTAGTNPSTVASKDANETKTDIDEAKDVDETTDKDTDTDKGSSGAKHGWGCGDDNHTHGGPSGRPGATMPTGCTKSH